ncbi:MAG: hypothetical protein ACI3VY_07375 [Faecousia sp.]
MNKREYDDDDGRVIVPMDVDGMPGFFKRRKKDENEETPRKQKIKLSKQEQRAVTGGVLRAAFTVLFIYAVVFALFILFCQFVWFK